MMYLGIDIGGTKTLIAVLDERGVIQERVKFETPRSYESFLKQVRDTVANLTTKKFKAAGVGVPATDIDRKKAIDVWFGNLPWHNVNIETDFRQFLNCPVVVENDAKLAGLSEAMLVKEISKVLYITISTGIGTALIVDQKIDTSIGDGGGKTLMIEHEGKVVPWESFASGKAIVKRFGKLAKDIHDAKTWRIIAHGIAVGLIEVIAITEPEIVVVGGGVGAYLPRFIKPLNEALKHYENAMLPIPPIVEAKRPDDAVVYGCYDLAKAIYG